MLQVLVIVEMLLDNDLKAVCTVTELAKKLSLSRARFYQLQKTGIFPKPIYCTRTKRPFYPLDLQQKCVDIRKTGIGHNGQPVIFYTSKQNKSRKSQNHEDRKYEELAYILNQMGLNLARNNVKIAVKNLYPEGLAQCPDEGMVIRDLFRYFK